MRFLHSIWFFGGAPRSRETDICPMAYKSRARIKTSNQSQREFFIPTLFSFFSSLLSSSPSSPSFSSSCSNLSSPLSLRYFSFILRGTRLLFFFLFHSSNLPPRADTQENKVTNRGKEIKIKRAKTNLSKITRNKFKLSWLFQRTSKSTLGI